MRGLSLLQPWASLVGLWQKKIETRSWSTDYRGDVLICASQSFRGQEIDLCREPPFANALTVRGASTAHRLGNAGFRHVATGLDGFRDWVCLPLGAALCVVELADVVSTASLRDLSPGERQFGDYSYGRFAWLFRNLRRLDAPIPIKGALGLWQVPDDIAAVVTSSLTVACQICGCTESEACLGGCTWASTNPPRCDRCEHT